MNVEETGLGSLSWIQQAQDGDQWNNFVHTEMNFRVPQNFGKFLSSRASG
jgi:hypothetical protein